MFRTGLRLFKSNKRKFSSFVGKTGGVIIKDKLIQHNVKDVFMYTGGAIMPVIDAFYNSEINYYINTHEQSLGHAATGYARTSGKPGICIVTSGPGLTNMVTAITDAQTDSTPLIVFSCQVPKKAMGTQAFQECPSVDITKSITKWSYCVNDIEELSSVVDKAFYIASDGKPGVVHIDLPKCITQSIFTVENEINSNKYIQDKEKTSETLIKKDNKLQNTNLGVSLDNKLQNTNLGVSLDNTSIFTEESLTDLVLLINDSKRPVIIAGKGCNRSYHKLRQLATTSNIPVTTTIHGMGLFDERDPLSLEFLGMHGNVAANYAVQNADLIINLGSRFDDRTTGNVESYAPKAKEAYTNGIGGIIHVNICEDDICSNIKSNYNFNCDTDEWLNYLVPRVRYKPRWNWLLQISGWKQKYPFDTNDPGDGTINTQMVIKEIDNYLDKYNPDYIITTGVGNHQMMASQFIKWNIPNSFCTSGSLGVMGVGLPYAIGAQIANPDSLVIDIDGDGSFNHTLAELKTVENYSLPIKIAITNDNELSMVKAWEKLFFEERYVATDLNKNPDYCKLAESFNIETIRCDNKRDLSDTVELFLNHPGAIVCDFRVKSDLCLPLVKPGNALDDMFLFQEINDFDVSDLEVPS